MAEGAGLDIAVGIDMDKPLARGQALPALVLIGRKVEHHGPRFGIPPRKLSLLVRAVFIGQHKLGNQVLLERNIVDQKPESRSCYPEAVQPPPRSDLSAVLMCDHRGKRKGYTCSPKSPHRRANLLAHTRPAPIIRRAPLPFDRNHRQNITPLPKQRNVTVLDTRSIRVEEEIGVLDFHEPFKKRLDQHGFTACNGPDEDSQLGAFVDNLHDRLDRQVLFHAEIQGIAAGARKIALPGYRENRDPGNGYRQFFSIAPASAFASGHDPEKGEEAGNQRRQGPRVHERLSNDNPEISPVEGIELLERDHTNLRFRAGVV